ncbi:MAG: hypothetical protein OIF51_19140 [Cellvibrionaceae bacterium]|nr:hypothetical protein [Cellvibrionaceae bacterium]
MLAALKESMNSAIKYIGYISISLVAVAVAFVGYSYIKSKKIENEVLELIPSLLAEISDYEQYSALGAYETCPTKESNQVEIQVTDPVQAVLQLDCNFRNGAAAVYIKLQRTDNEWVVSKLRVNSDVFAPHF